MLVFISFTLMLSVLSSPISYARDMPNNGDAPRFPADQQTPEQKAAFAEAERLVKATYGSSFQLKDAQGNLLGPFGVLSYTPTTFLPYLNYTQAYTVLPHLTAKERELSILATASVTESEYIIYAHKSIGISVGLSKKQVKDASEGEVPEGLGKREKFVYKTALRIAKKFGTISDDLFEEAVQQLGRDGVSQLAQEVGGYLLSSVLVNVADVQVPTT